MVLTIQVGGPYKTTMWSSLNNISKCASTLWDHNSRPGQGDAQNKVQAEGRRTAAEQAGEGGGRLHRIGISK